eukprot:14561725-Alexandrium_andersonii.AAC.1
MCIRDRARAFADARGRSRKWLQVGQRLTYTDKRITSAANRSQQFAAVCCAASPEGLPHPGPPKKRLRRAPEALFGG